MATTTQAFTSVGTTLSIAVTPIATKTAVGYAAGPWVEIGEVDNIGDITVTDEIQARVPLKTGITTKTKGATNYEPFDVSGGWASGDVGQVALATARTQRTAVSYKIAYADGSMEYGDALVTARTKTIGDSSAFTGFSCTIEPTGASIEVPKV
jgi:hypothetical protein